MSSRVPANLPITLVRRPVPNPTRPCSSPGCGPSTRPTPGPTSRYRQALPGQTARGRLPPPPSRTCVTPSPAWAPACRRPPPASTYSASSRSSTSPTRWALYPLMPAPPSRLRSDAGGRGASLATRIMSEVEVGLLIRATPPKRDRMPLEVIYAGGFASPKRSPWPGPTYYLATIACSCRS